jgi:hypothetical protein
LQQNSNFQKTKRRITVTLGGAPLTLLEHYFLDQNTAADIVTQYIEAGSGARPSHDSWIEA